MTELDPTIAAALNRLVPPVSSDPVSFLAAAKQRREALATTRRRRTRRTLVVALAAGVLLAGGVAIAATQFDVLPWLDRSTRSDATFSVDPNTRYDGSAPAALRCPGAGPGEFTCSPSRAAFHGKRTYVFTERIEPQPQITRDRLLEELDQAEQHGMIDPATAASLRLDVETAGDDFYRALSLLASVRTNGGGSESVPGQPGYELVPPDGVPLWVACHAEEGSFTCRDLAHSLDVPVGTPTYMLMRSDDWVAPRRTESPTPDIAGLFHAMLGRDLQPSEIRILIALITVGGEAKTSGGKVVPAQ